MECTQIYGVVNLQQSSYRQKLWCGQLSHSDTEDRKFVYVDANPERNNFYSAVINSRYLLGVKQADHQFLFDWVDHTDSTVSHESLDEKGVMHRFRYLNQAPLNDHNFE